MLRRPHGNDHVAEERLHCLNRSVWQPDRIIEADHREPLKYEVAVVADHQLIVLVVWQSSLWRRVVACEILLLIAAHRVHYAVHQRRGADVR